eukprot:gnl/Carplike_NY0171/1297_a1759_1309.p1 GENE.gnl/Carplike_NY0171/1297_a1759_1309~~gnl/Carplike_NY0171/1297_a1759_1309.p1  ORF type:complete len:180 (-),score=44.53 gnl/Carplike_NY0171/1297_a1759_1309:153-611(-)
MSKDKAIHAGSYQESLKKLLDISTVEEFWGVYESIPACDKLDTCNICLFVKEVAPEWEDPMNSGGYNFTLDLPSQKEQAQDIWKNLLMDLVGHKFPSIDYITGIVLKKRTKDNKARLTVWTTKIKEEIKREIMSFLERETKVRKITAKKVTP